MDVNSEYMRLDRSREAKPYSCALEAGDFQQLAEKVDQLVKQVGTSKQ